MAYRVIKSKTDGSIDIITSDGGIASFYHNGDNYATTYFQRRLSDCNPENYVWDELSNGKIYFKDWEGEPTDDEVIYDALNWLCPFVDVGKVDDTIWSEFFKSDEVERKHATHWVVCMWTKSVVAFSSERSAIEYKDASHKRYRLIILSDFSQVEEYCDDRGVDPENYRYV